MNFIHVMFERPHRLFAIFCRDYLIAQTHENFLRGLTQVIVVFGDQNAFGATAQGTDHWAFRLICRAVAQWQIDPECRALPQCAVHIDEAFVLLDDSVHGGQTETCSTSYFFGCEKRLEDMGQRFSIHPGA